MAKLIDLTGKTFYNLTVIEKSLEKSSTIKWICSCVCGNKCVVSGSNLKNSHTKSCGCLQRERASTANKIDLIGRSFGRLTVIKEIAERNKRKIKWECLCECGNTTNVASNHLLSGVILSCGCYRTELSRLRSGRNSPMYNSLLTDEERYKKRETLEYNKWKRYTKRNKNFTCEICSSKEKINSHHLYSYKQYPEIRTKEWNCAILCQECHIFFHRIYGKHNNNFNQFAEFYKNITKNEYVNELAKNYE